MSPGLQPIPIVLIYWGRRGAGATIADHIAESLVSDGRFTLFVSNSAQSETTPSRAVDAAHLLPLRTFAGPVSLVLRTLALPWIMRRLVKRLSDNGVQAAITVMPHVWGWAFQRAARKAGIRTILMVHDADPHPGETRPVFDSLVRMETRASDRIVTLSNHVAGRLIALGLAAEPRLTRLSLPILSFPGGVDPRAHPAKPFRLLFFGRILPYKGVPLLLDAFALLREAGIDCTLRVVGRGRIDAPPDLRKQPGLTIEEGWVSPQAVGFILTETDAIVLPYVEASQSGVAPAAYGAGLPVVATPIGGLIEQVVGGETGILADAVTAPALAAAIRKLIETPGLYDACRAGVARYAEHHSADRFAARLGDAVFETLTSQSI